MYKWHTLVSMNFEWDENKRRSNLLKHRVDFADAVGVFYDGNAMTVEDPEHHDEQWLMTLGMDDRLQVLGWSIRKETVTSSALFLHVKQMAKNANSTKVISMRDHDDFSEGKRGAIVKTAKERITIRLVSDLIQWFKDQVQGGGNYQSLINEALRQHVQRQGEPLEDTLRRVIREEMHVAGSWYPVHAGSD